MTSSGSTNMPQNKKAAKYRLRNPKRPMITLEKVLSICARPSKDQNVRAYNTSTIPNELHARSPTTYIGSSDESARTNIIGACTTNDANAAGTGWYIPSFTSFFSDSHW